MNQHSDMLIPARVGRKEKRSRQLAGWLPDWPWEPTKEPTLVNTKEEEEKSVTRCTRDYVATNRWLGKGCSRKEQGGRHETPTPKGSNALKGYNMFNHSICPPTTVVTWQAMKPVNRKRPAPDGGPKAIKGIETKSNGC